jgi:tRNA-splicing ligase RtcB (3'-phosphate/5'-hydroxy nucleic acid ligase)
LIFETMSIKQELKQISEILWEIPRSFRADMRVPARVYATKEMLQGIIQDRSLEQLINVASLPGIQKCALVMPDVHEGYGFPIGGVAATRYPDGVISPGGIGYDINCGVKLLKSNMTGEDLAKYLQPLSKEIFKQVPSGVGRSGFLKLSTKNLDRVLEFGVQTVIEDSYGEREDLNFIESNGTIANADPKDVSFEAKKRGQDQLGTMGAGNHFVEIDKVSKIFDEKIAASYGLFENQIVIMIHTGSRGLGHQVATDYIRTMLKVLNQYKITLPDRELACVPLSSPEGKAYFSAMACAANFAFSNRQLITWEIRQAWNKVLGNSAGPLTILYDIAHNIAKIEEHRSNGNTGKLIVHRKGATRAFGPGNPELPEVYRAFGQPVLIPGSMGTASYVLAGTEKSMEETFGSTCHGAGRQMSRHAARKKIQGDQLQKQLYEQGITIQAGSMRGLSEEAPFAYKDVDSVVDVVDRAGIARKVAKLRPLAVIKG